MHRMPQAILLLNKHFPRHAVKQEGCNYHEDRLNALRVGCAHQVMPCFSPAPPCSAAHLVVHGLPALAQRAPAAHAGGLLVQVDSDVLLQLLVDLLEGPHLLDVLHQAAVQALVGEPPALLQPRGQGHGGAGAAQALQEDAADAQRSAGHAGAQAAHSSGGHGAHVDAGRPRQAAHAHPAPRAPHALGGGGRGLLPQEGRPAPGQGHAAAAARSAPPPAPHWREGCAEPSRSGLGGAFGFVRRLSGRRVLCIVRAAAGSAIHFRGNLPAAAAANVADEQHNGVYRHSGAGIHDNVRVEMPAVFAALTPG